MYHYVYRITNTLLNKHYYGKRSSKHPPHEDLGIHYFSSSRDREFKIDQKNNPQNYKYKVIVVTTSALKALALEIRLHDKFDVAKNPLFYNKAKQTAVKFTTAGTKASLSTRVKQSKALTGRTFSPEHKAKISAANKNRTITAATRQKFSQQNKNKVVVKHSVTGEVLRVDTTDPRYVSKELVSINLGKTSSEVTKQKQLAKRIKSANIYCFHTNSLIAENVVLSYWAVENGYSPGTLSATTKADRNMPSNNRNPHHHKGVYAKYNKKEK